MNSDANNEYVTRKEFATYMALVENVVEPLLVYVEGLENRINELQQDIYALEAGKEDK